MEVPACAVPVIFRYCSHPAGVHSNGICPLKVACGEGQIPRNHHFIGPDAVQLGARHGVNSNHLSSAGNYKDC